MHVGGDYLAQNDTATATTLGGKGGKRVMHGSAVSGTPVRLTGGLDSVPYTY